jgi:hypothetical protein
LGDFSPNLATLDYYPDFGKPCQSTSNKINMIDLGQLFIAFCPGSCPKRCRIFENAANSRGGVLRNTCFGIDPAMNPDGARDIFFSQRQQHQLLSIFSDKMASSQHSGLKIYAKKFWREFLARIFGANFARI